jgi:hypothetical protein
MQQMANLLEIAVCIIVDLYLHLAQDADEGCNQQTQWQDVGQIKVSLGFRLLPTIVASRIIQFLLVVLLYETDQLELDHLDSKGHVQCVP